MRLIPLSGIPEVRPGDDLPALLCEAAERAAAPFADDDVLVVAHKVVSKAEGRLVAPGTVEPSAEARRLAAATGRRPEEVELVLREAARVVRATPRAIVVETRHGFVCANAGVDWSNADGVAVLLPEDPDASARRIREGIRRRTGAAPAVVVSDTFGRPWRLGQVNVAVGVAGMLPIRDHRGEPDRFGRVLRVTQIAVADELAAAAELCMGKADGIPAVLVKGCRYPRGDGRARDLVRPAEQDLFR
ncbi:MAG: coenzyme F420-0:L-glutamate ligase [Clostridia bacterium]|nr:coenzyme F420-0:L-glutamate ligase [Clostridia bacterium]